MNGKTMTKAIATFLAFIISFANVAFLGSYAGKTYAAESNLEEQATNVKNAEIEFDAYFQEEGQEVHKKAVKVEEEAKLYFRLKVEEGYLKNGSIQVDNANFKVQETKNKLDKVQSISSEENKIILNHISKDEAVILEVPIKMKTGSEIAVSDLSKIASLTLEGTYVNEKGKETNVKKTIETEVSIDGEAEGFLSAEIVKYVTFDVGGSQGVILQTLIQSNLLNNQLPTKTTKLEIEIPTINHKEPKMVTLSAKTLMATKGIGSKVFHENEYQYENGKITLMLENNNENLSWIKESKDEIILTCIYDETAITDQAEVELSATSEITYYAKELKTATTEVKNKVELTNQIGEIVTFDIATSTENLFKGYMQEPKGNNTKFTDTLSINIGYHELVDRLTFKDETSYVDANGNLYPSNAIYSNLKIAKENLVEILGEDGYIKVYSKSGELITTLNKENTNYTFETGADNIIFETSKPISEGVLNLENEREILPLEYTKAQLDMFTGFRVNLVGNVLKEEKVVISGNSSKEIGLQAPETKAELKISNSNLSTVVKNEGVELRVILNTSDMSTVLYENPEVAIILPKYITNIQVENVKLIYEKVLKLADARIDRNENGNIVIHVKLSGSQTTYNQDAITKGATLIMKADIETDALTPTKTEMIQLKIKNAKSKEEMVTETPVKFIAPAGIATVSQIAGYSDTGETAVSISGKTGVGAIKATAPAKVATVKNIAMNNYLEACENVVILGRTPTEGNKKVTTGEDLGSTFTAKAVSEIKNQNGLTEDQMTVYYSENKEATKDLNDLKNAWTTNPRELKNVASYMIVLQDYTFQSGDILEFQYDVEIPANVGESKAAYGTSAIYYEKVAAEENTMAYSLARTQSYEGAPIGVESDAQPNLSVKLTAEKIEIVDSKANVEAGQLITYKAEISNLGKVVAENVILNVDLLGNATLVTPSDFTIEEDKKEEENPDEDHDEGYMPPELDVSENTKQTIRLAVGEIEAGQDGKVSKTFEVLVGNYEEENNQNIIVR